MKTTLAMILALAGSLHSYVAQAVGTETLSASSAQCDAIATADFTDIQDAPTQVVEAQETCRVP